MSGNPSGPFRLGDLVERFGGTLSDNADARVSGFATLERATAEHLSFLSNPKYRAATRTCRAAAVLVNAAEAKGLESSNASSAPALWVVPDPYLHFARIAQYMQDQRRQADPVGIHASAVVDPSAHIDPTASILAHAVIGADVEVGPGAIIGPGCIVGRGVVVGAATHLHAQVTIYDECLLGQRCIVHSGAVIGADGFGFARDGATWVKIPQTGRVVIGDDVEIGANTTIDRGALDDTVIGSGVKLDNQIQIGHNVRIGEHTAIAGCVAIAGSVTIGCRCTIAGGVGIVGHVELADEVHVTAFTLVSRSIPQAGQYSGSYPMGTHAEWEKNAAALRTLANLRERLRAVERQLKNEKPE